MSDNAQGGNDVLTGGSNSGSGSIFQHISGDGQLLDNAQGGNDVLTGGSNSGSGNVTNIMWGDGSQVSGSAQRGNDQLISGTNATDEIWGDWAIDEAGNIPDDGSTGGSDTFVFLANNGQDTIHDFRRADGDKIDLIALPSISNFDVLDSNLDGSLDDSDAFVSVSGSNTVIDLGAAAGGAAGANTVTILGIADLVAPDFLLS